MGAIVPSAPLLVPELAGPCAPDCDPVRAAVHAVAEELGQSAARWVAVGAADAGQDAVDSELYRRTGDFGAYGVRTPVSLGAGPAGAVPLPLSMLIAGWVDGLAGGQHALTPLVVDPVAPPARCLQIGERLAAEIAASAEPVGVLVVADGANALSPSAPGGGERASAAVLQGRIDDALGRADGAALAALTVAECDAEGVRGRPAWQVLAGLSADTEMVASTRYAGAPFGVGYTVAVWTPTGTKA